MAALSVLAIGGSFLAVAGKGKPVGALGGVVALGAVGALGAKRATEAIDGAQAVPMFPDTHLLAGPFSVPPGLFTKKWVLLNTRMRAGAECMGSMVIDYEIVEKGHERVLLDFKDRSGHSEWQDGACYTRI
jgi:hypothetical protein